MACTWVGLQRQGEGDAGRWWCGEEVEVEDEGRGEGWVTSDEGDTVSSLEDGQVYHSPEKYNNN